jgi:hypothetical protein
MHRTKTRLAARAHRVATKIEKRGGRATYHLHDHVLSNRSARRNFEASPPRLDDLQRRIVSELEQDGYSLLSFSDLVPEDEWRAIDEQASAFITHTEAGLAGDGEDLRVRQGKEFVVRLHSYEVELGDDDHWFRACTSHRMLDIANTYLGLWSKLEYVDMWYSVPQPAEKDRVSSQRWHRDFNDKHLLKAFLYLVDVDEETGPFQFVPGSQAGGRYSDAWPWRPLGENYPPESELEQRIPPNGVKTFTGPKGTFLFCNTSGFHRGGFATSQARVLATCTYSSPASLASLTDRSFSYTGSVEALDDATRFALT